jgi:hypothetical protein
MSWDTAQARDRNRAQPVYLVEIQTLNGGPLLKFADRNILVGAVQYADYIGSLSGISGTLDRATSGATNSNASVVFKNDPYDAYAYLSDLSEDYPLEGAAIEVKELFIDDVGAQTTPTTIFTGNLDSPTGITSIAFSCAAMSRETFASITNR